MYDQVKENNEAQRKIFLGIFENRLSSIKGRPKLSLLGTKLATFLLLI